MTYRQHLSRRNSSLSPGWGSVARTLAVGGLASMTIWANLGTSYVPCFPAWGADLLFHQVELTDGSMAPKSEQGKWRDMKTTGIESYTSFGIHRDGAIYVGGITEASCD